MVANRIETLYIADPLGEATTSLWKAYGQTQRKTSTIYRSDVTIYESGELAEPRPRLSIKGLDLVLLSTDNRERVQIGEDTFFVETWKPDAKMMTSVNDLPVCNELPADLTPVFTRDDHEAFQLASSIFVLDSLEIINGLNLADLPSHLRAFVDWIKTEAENITQGRAPFVDVATLDRVRANPDLRNGLLKRVSKWNARGELVIRVGSNVKPILKQETDSLEFMFGGDDIMSRTYDEGLPGDVAVHLGQYLDCLAHNQSGLRILEVGGGTGSATRVILDAFRRAGGRDAVDGIAPIARYDFTDISAAFFEKAKSRFADWSDVVRCKTFDIEKDARQQGFEHGAYDIILASSVSSMKSALSASLPSLDNMRDN
ncbi:hypothetical protein CDD83_3267 [Cordyceps sp. RAO-2017]|nr:hypothetical protein CDD83_3267 [Cordyceps sp. RAO-2017]